MKTIKGKSILFLLLYGVWLLLTAPADVPEIVTGGIFALIIAILPWGNTIILHELRISPRSILYMFIYLFIFLKALILSNLDVALRVLSPRLPTDSGIVRVRTRLKSRLGRLILANSITLTPGTITVETRDEDFFVHWIDVKGESIEERTKKIVSNFEKYLEVFLG